MPGVRVIKPVDVVAAPDLTISEYIGRVASKDANVSACVATVRKATKESPQTPHFDEYVLVLEGECHILFGKNLEQRVVVRAGEAFVLDRGTRVQWVWPGPCKYVPICLPAFSPSNCGREEASGPVAKTEESMSKLRALHAASSPVSQLSSSWLSSMGIGLGIGMLLGVAATRAFRSHY
jgi:mannose-6-phosphate isomerase-like protein (cupin superfamily)